VQRYLAGEKVKDICLSLKRSPRWLHKWIARYRSGKPQWFEEESRRPQTFPRRIPFDVEQAVRMARLDLYNQGLFCGAQAILWQLQEWDVQPLPSVRTVNRILSRKGLTHRRTGRYEPTGKKYPRLEGTSVNHVHQSDFVGPSYLRGPIRFYSLNTVDLATGRCALEPLIERDAQHTIDAFWAIWRRLGLPDHQQVDNEMVFYGSPAHPRGMGSLIRLCLHCGIELWFIPKGEPWRNGVVEKFNDHYGQKFLRRIEMADEKALREQALLFEHKHNQQYRYSKLKGRTPQEALAMSNKPLCFPTDEQAPRHPLPKPEYGKYHLVRFIRSDGQLDVFGEKFSVSQELFYEYIIATIDVKEQKLKLYLNQTQVDEIDYKLF
jgi:transposase InsO family protein